MLCSSYSIRGLSRKEWMILIQQMEELKEEWLGELGEFLERRRRGMGDVVTRAGSCRWRGVDVP